MKFAVLTFVMGLALSATASAMPAFDGTYLCTVPGGLPQTITLETRDNKLYVKSTSTNPTDGIPCSNGTDNQSANGVTVTLTTSCNDTTLSALVTVVQPSTDTDASILTRFQLVNEKTVDMYVKATGKSNGKDVGGETAITCVK